MKYLIIVEGESDCWALWHAGFPALGLPGASNVKCLRPEHVAGFDTILVVSEPDAAGQKFPESVADHLRGVGYQGSVVTLAMGPTGYKDPSALHCADPLTFKEKFDALIKEALSRKEDDKPPMVAAPYEIDEKGRTMVSTYRNNGKNEVITKTELANFHARIAEDTELDDGVMKERHLIVVAQVDHKGPQTIEIPAKLFNRMEWVSQLRGGAVVTSGNGKRDQLREAIERLSGKVKERTIYTHTGWREIDERWVYLHGAGAICEDGAVAGLQAELPPSLAEFRLPAPPEPAELRQALQESARMLECGDVTITLPLFAAIWRSAIDACDFSVFLVGQTGSYKSSLAAIAMRHYGAGFDRDKLPASWASTANFLENLAFHAKDALLVIDDFRPATHGFDRELQKEAERIFRAQGNRSGRGRMNADGSERTTKTPRGMILTTAEEFVWGSSLEARQVVLEVPKGGLDLNKLITLHEVGNQGILASAMAGWIQWLAGRLEGVRRRILLRAAEIAKDFTGSHPRVALALGQLQATLEIWTEFSEIRLQSVVACFRELADSEAETREEYQEPSKRFADLLVSALMGGKCHVITNNQLKPGEKQALGWRLDKTGSYVPQGPSVLWVDETTGEWLLDINLAYSVVMSMSNDGNRPNVGVRMLTKLLSDNGYTLRSETNESRRTHKVRKMIQGTVHHFLAVAPEKFGLPSVTSGGWS